jgi:hypothetical protein
MTLPYDRSFSPPAPALMVEVYSPDDPTQRQQILAKLDTAADITVISAQVLDTLNAEVFSMQVVSGYESTPIAVSTYVVGIELPTARIRRIEVVPISEDYVLLGRDVLNLFYITLDGPDLTFELRTEH